MRFKDTSEVWLLAQLTITLHCNAIYIAMYVILNFAAISVTLNYNVFPLNYI